MTGNLHQAREILGRNPRLTGFEIRPEGNELHLEKGGEIFARLLRQSGHDFWRIELFRPSEGWEIVDFTGSLEECLEFLTDHPHYLFWEQ